MSTSEHFDEAEPQSQDADGATPEGDYGGDTGELYDRTGPADSTDLGDDPTVEGDGIDAPDNEVFRPRRAPVVVERLGEPVSTRVGIIALSIAAAWVLVLGTVGVLSGQAPGVPSAIEHTASAEVAPHDSSQVTTARRGQVFRVETASQTGSGFLIEDDLVMTNAHVVTDEGAHGGKKVTVYDTSGRKLHGKVVMTDPAMDIALVQVPEQDAKPVTLVGSADAEAGQPVTLLGFPLGLDLSVSSGVVSAVDQSTDLKESAAQTSLLQVDAPVNPGNSGGAVFDSRGRVLGMITFRPDRTGSRPVQGVSFAVPSDDLQIALLQFQKYGDVRYGHLGVTIDSHSDTTDKGTLVSGVSGSSPARRAGIKEGDIIVSIDGQAATSYAVTSRLLHAHRPGDTVKITVLRDGKKVGLHATLGLLED